MNRLKELREEKNLSTRGLAAMVDINHMAINYYENEKRDFNTTALKTLSIFFDVTIDYLLCHSSYYLFVNYHNIMLKVNEEDYKLLYKDGFIYFDNNKRYINLNKLIGLDNDNDLFDFIIDLYRHKRLDGLFDKNDTSIFEKNNDVVEIILDKEFIEYMKKSLEL
ncbi:MAG: helix-turn-helix transcriptional regulator [Bacilli bacterium]|nr:helix-turn-helix transcriptional regulator [Bacilli bacterium]